MTFTNALQLIDRLERIRMQTFIRIDQTLDDIANRILEDAVMNLKHNKTIDTGHLMSKIFKKRIKACVYAVGVNESEVPYAPYVEFGTRPRSRMPPLESLLLSRKFRDKTRKELFAIAKHIKEHGTKPYPFLGPAWNKWKNEIPKRISQILRLPYP